MLSAHTQALRRRHILTCGADTFVKIFETENLNPVLRSLYRPSLVHYALLLLAWGNAAEQGVFLACWQN